MVNNTKQVIVIRKDLGMRLGKMVAQGAHASMKAILEKGVISKNTLSVAITNETSDWLLGKFTKICVRVNSEDELVEIFERAASMNIPCSLIVDSGLTEFHGVPTKTAVAIGPADSEIIDKITGHLTLL